ncbi:MAG: hypothetical protein RLZZ480_482 [Candidatus Parcubacteria bacterium]
MPKKLLEIPLDELIVAALEEARNYPLILDNDQLDVLFKNKFVTDKGVQLPPKELVAKIVKHIEDNPPQTTDQFAKFVRETLVEMSTQAVSAKKKK